jgi:hypothetical protein
MLEPQARNEQVVMMFCCVYVYVRTVRPDTSVRLA